jgi:hypothetical protein
LLQTLTVVDTVDIEDFRYEEDPMVDQLPVVVVGSGPVGVAAAAHLRERGLEPLVLEQGPAAGAAVAQWAHVRLFSTWRELVDPAAARLLEPLGWSGPDPATYPNGGDWVRRYLAPLAEALGGHVRCGARVTGVARRGRDLVVDSGRGGVPLVVHVTTDAGEERIEARGLIDASGTWGRPGPLGSDGLPAVGEALARDRMSYRVPDPADPATVQRYAGRRTVVAGSGASAFTALLALDAIAREHPGTEIGWLLRRGLSGSTFGGGEADELPARGALGLSVKAAVDAGRIRATTGFRTTGLDVGESGRLVLEAADGRRLEGVDEIVVLTGFRPELSWLSEVRLQLDPVLQAPARLAPLIDPNVHSCGTVYPHGAAELAQPEADVYLVGMKSYGRAPTFLAMTGYEQVRSVAAALAGDVEAAARVELTLPETGVCGGAGLFDESAEAASAGCCGPVGAGPAAPATIELSAVGGLHRS